MQQHQDQTQKDHDNSTKIGKNMMLIAWILALTLLTWSFGVWEEKKVNPNNSPTSYHSEAMSEVVLLRNRQGHYLVTGSVNDNKATFLLDTGATLVAVPGELQIELGLITGDVHYSHTANGTAKAYSTVIKQLTIGDINLQDVKASVIPSMQGKEILLGMSALKQLEFTQKGQQLTLRQLN